MLTLTTSSNDVQVEAQVRQVGVCAASIPLGERLMCWLVQSVPMPVVRPQGMCWYLSRWWVELDVCLPLYMALLLFSI